MYMDVSIKKYASGSLRRVGEPLMGSGITLTTLLDTILNICLMAHFGNEKCVSVPTANKIGVSVTIENCENIISKIQFLKTTPLKNGGYFVNFGPMLRSLGTCKGEYPGSGSILNRARCRFTEVVNGYVGYGDSRLYNALRSSPAYLPFITSIYSETYHEYDSNNYVSDDVVCARYNCHVSEYIEFCDLLSQLDVAQVLSHTFMDKVMLVDYGQKESTSPPPIPGAFSPDVRVVRSEHGFETWETQEF